MNTRETLARELVELADRDHAVRSELVAAGTLHGGYHPEMKAVHRRNGDRLSQVLDDLGQWPGVSMIGAEGAHAAWLIAMHDIANPPLMRRSLTLISDALTDGDADALQHACLLDRIRAFEGKPQLYGTQLGWNDDGTFGIWPAVDDIDATDARRNAIGLTTMAEHQAAARSDASRHTEPMTNDELAEFRDRERAFLESSGWRQPTGVASPPPSS